MATDTSSVLFVTQILVAGVASVINILASRTLDPSGRGELALLLQIAYLSSLGLLLGTDRSIVAVLTGHPVRTVTATAIRMLATPSIVVIVGVAVLIWVPIPGLESWTVRLILAFAFMIVNAFSRAVRSIAIAADRQRDYFWYSLANQGLLIAAVGVLYFLEEGSSALWMAAYLVAGTPATAIWLLRWLRSDASSAPAARDGARSEVRREGLVLFPATIAHSGTLRIDRLLLAGLASTSSLGIYTAVATMTELVAWPLMAYADSRLGRWRTAHDGDGLPIRSVLLGACAYGAVGAVLLSVILHLLLVPMLGEAYRPALDLIVPLVVAAAVFGLSQIMVNMLAALRRGGLASLVELVGLGVSLVAYVILIERYGAIGAAYGSLIGYTSCLVVAGVLLARAQRRAHR